MTRAEASDRLKPRWFDAAIRPAGSRLPSNRWLDMVVWFSALAALVVNAATMPSLYRAFVPLALVASALHAVSLPVALTRPRVAVVLCTLSMGGTTFLTATRADWPWPIPVVSLVITALLCAVLAVRERWPYAVIGGLLAVVVPGLSAVVVLTARDEWVPISQSLLTAASVLALVTTFGVLIRESLASRAELLEQQELTAAEQGRRQLVEERNRIARELHDTVAHSLSIISIQASTVRYRIEGVSEETIGELDQITETARAALLEMRGLLAVLRQEDAERDLAPQPTLGRIGELVEHARRGGADVRFQAYGDLDDVAVSDTTAISAYRIVQEALSNALRHAPGAPIDVAIAVGAEVVVIDVQNPAPPTAPGQSDAPGGFGLLGMRERATFVGGRLHAGPLQSGGFGVHAELPTKGRSERGGSGGDSGPGDDTGPAETAGPEETGGRDDAAGPAAHSRPGGSPP